MKRIIDIPDRTYDFIMGLNQYTFGSKYAHKDVQADIVKAVKESIPYNPTEDAISRSALKEQMKELLNLSVKRVNDTPNNSPCYRMYVAQENERARLIDLIDNAPTVPLPDFKAGYKQAIIDGRTNFKQKGEWVLVNTDCRGYSEYFKCSICGAYIYPSSAEKELDYNGCPYCFADMRGDNK